MLAGFLMSGGNGKMLGAAVVVILATLGWTLAHMLPFFYVMRALGLLRVAEAEELMGLDKSHHGGSAYDMDVGKIAANYGGDGGVEGSRHNNIVQRCALCASVHLLSHCDGSFTSLCWGSHTWQAC